MQAVAKGFFDADKVVRSIKDAKRRSLSKFGAYVRQRAKTSIRKRKRISSPGSPPSSHAGQLRGLIFFAWDSAIETVVVGPVPFTSKVGRGIVPGVLERGGTVTRDTKAGKTAAHVAPRPFMAPALAAERPKFAETLRGLIR